MSCKNKKELWNIANTLRGKMDPNEFKNYILGFIFYKYLSDQIEIYTNDLLKNDNIKYFELEEPELENQNKYSKLIDYIKERFGCFLKPKELFSQVLKRSINKENKGFIIDDLIGILKNIEQTALGAESEEVFKDLFEDLDLNSTKLGKTPDQKNESIVKILKELSSIDFELQNDNDTLGDAYEYLIGQFAAGAGKKGGEFYTPQCVSKVLAKIVTTGKTKLDSVYDPTCGSGSLFLRISKEVKKVYNYYGQELNRTTYNLARMNMIMHGVSYRDFDIKQDDTLERPQHGDKKFEAIVANPPFSAQWSGNQLFLNNDRFSQYGKLAPSSKADYAFVQHMIHHLADNGVMAVVLPHGVLFRGNSEGHIRKYLIENKNYLDAVIGLPANIFFGTSIPTCILVFKKCRENNDNIIFIDASNEFEKNKNQNSLTDENIEKIIDTYRNRKEIGKYSHLASLEEIRENDFNLNIPRYVNTFAEEEQIDLNFVSQELKKIDDEIRFTDETIIKFCDELGIGKPF